VAPLVRVPRTLPTILSPVEVDRLAAALRTHRDQAMVAAMLFGGLRRCEVLGLRFERATTIPSPKPIAAECTTRVSGQRARASSGFRRRASPDRVRSIDLRHRRRSGIIAGGS